MATRTIASLQKDLDALLGRLSELQKKMGEGPLSQNEGEEFDEKAEEASGLQAELDRMKAAEKFKRTPKDPAVPAPRPAEDGGDGDDRTYALEPAAQITLGDLFVSSKEYQAFLQAGMPQAYSQAVPVKSLFKNEILRGLRLKELRSRLETKGVPVIGPDVIVPFRDPEQVRIPAQQIGIPTLRRLITVMATTSNAVSYVTYTFTGSPEVVPEGEPKPENDAEFESETVPVRTIAKWIPVTEQQLEDLPSLAGTINMELLYELALFEEQEMLWGTAATGFSGLLNPATGVPTIPTPAAGRVPENVIEQVRMGITDVIMRGGRPTAAMLHPIDWEAAELAKGTDAHYIWVVVQDEAQQRLWGLEIVQSMNMQQPGTTDPEDRRLLVGDFPRGATLYDRQSANIAVGWINDQFVRNMRSIRAEERAAFAVKRPFFFAVATPITDTNGPPLDT